MSYSSVAFLKTFIMKFRVSTKVQLHRQRQRRRQQQRRRSKWRRRRRMRQLSKSTLRAHFFFVVCVGGQGMETCGNDVSREAKQVRK